MKKNFVADVDVHDLNSESGKRLSIVRITRQGAKRVARVHLVRGASRRRMLRVLEAM